MNDKNDTPPATRARLPRGFADRAPADIAATGKMLEAIKETYELYGFEAVETPLIEFTDALGKFLPDQDRPNEGVFSFRDDDESWLSLRYDLTAPLARYVAENFDHLPKPYRSYRAGTVFRNEKPGPGRFRQFMQFDADTVGSASVAADAEMCMMAADTLERLGIKRGDYVIKVNNRKLLDGVMEAIDLDGEDNSGRRLTVLRALDKLDRLGLKGVRALLGPGRKDESGDFTKGAGLTDEQISLLSVFFEMRIASPTIRNDTDDRNFNRSVLSSLEIRELYRGSGAYEEGLNELHEIALLTSAAGYGYSRIRIDHSVVRGLEYYTGPVFEAELTFDVSGEDGKPVRFGSIGGGGRYDGLVGRFRGDNVPATGFSIGVSELYSALKAINSPIVAGATTRGPVVVLVLDKDQLRPLPKFCRKTSRGKDQRRTLSRTVRHERAAEICRQARLGLRRHPGLERARSKDRPHVTIRDLVLGAELAASTKDRADYLELRAKAQLSVPEDQLVKSVQEVLARHGATSES